MDAGVLFSDPVVVSAVAKVGCPSGRSGALAPAPWSLRVAHRRSSREYKSPFASLDPGSEHSHPCTSYGPWESRDRCGRHTPTLRSVQSTDASMSTARPGIQNV
jgi:hypothetical protein